FLPNVLVDSATGQIAIDLGLRGPNYAPVSACATGSHAAGGGAETIRRGGADVVLARGTGPPPPPIILARFCALRGPAAAANDPALASRLFDASRAGFVMGEGACVLVLEERERAVSRGARVYAEVLGYGTSNDAHHMAQPDPESVGVAEMTRSALQRADVTPDRVGYINAHGTSTPQGDLAETKAIKDVFGEHAYELAVSSTKSVLGHLLGAGAPLRRGGRRRGEHARRGAARGRPPPDDQLPHARPRVRPRLRPERGATRPGGGRAVERDGPRRAQRLRLARTRLTTRARRH